MVGEVPGCCADEAAACHGKGPAHTTRLGMIAVGLGYITLGRALNTLAGGERQRLKLAISMAKTGAVDVVDRPPVPGVPVIAFSNARPRPVVSFGDVLDEALSLGE